MKNGVGASDAVQLQFPIPVVRGSSRFGSLFPSRLVEIQDKCMEGTGHAVVP